MSDETSTVKNDRANRKRGANGNGREAILHPRSARLAPILQQRAFGGRDREVPEGRSDGDILARERAYRRLLGVADVLSAALAVFVGVELLGKNDSLTLAVVVALPAVLLVSKTLGLYDRDEHVLKKTTLDEAPALFQVATLYAFVIWLCESWFVRGELGTGQVLGLWGLLFVSMLVVRISARAACGRWLAPERCLVVGDVGSAARVSHKFDTLPGVCAEVLGRVPIRSEQDRNDSPPHLPFGAPPTLGDLDALGLVLVEKRIHRVVIAPGAADSREVLNVVRLVKSLGVRVSMLPRLTEVVGSSVEFDDLEGLTMLGLRRYGLSRSSRALKRSMDLVVSLAILLVLAPLLAVIALAVKLGSPGPVLFRQQRIGLEGQGFEMLKFRSMHEDAEQARADLEELNEADDGLFKIADDPRLTRVGAFLRRASLDELPQLLNVVRGDMSLVGPRPLVPDEDRQVQGLDRRRLHVMPGVTGVWQIYGSSRVPMREMVTVDYLYGANWSLWLDVKILLRTVPHAIGRRNL